METGTDTNKETDRDRSRGTDRDRPKDSPTDEADIQFYRDRQTGKERRGREAVKQPGTAADRQTHSDRSRTEGRGEGGGGGIW